MMTDDRVDLREMRAGLKLRQDTGATKLFENMDGVACPACGDSFDEVLASKERTQSFDPPRRIGFCIVREDERVLVFTHEP